MMFGLPLGASPASIPDPGPPWFNPLHVIPPPQICSAFTTHPLLASSLTTTLNSIPQTKSLEHPPPPDPQNPALQVELKESRGVEEEKVDGKEGQSEGEGRDHGLEHCRESVGGRWKRDEHEKFLEGR
jgi:hypothetical protein